MGYRHFLLVCATLVCFIIAAVLAKGHVKKVKSLASRFSCRGRPQGYYADIDTGCQVYHMCDGLGRQFSYSCPNTTLFQQRMLVCDHWYMVNCSKAEKDYSANLLIGQRNKPFVLDAEMKDLRTPRPDILTVPANERYFDGLREAESKFSVHPNNNIVGLSNSIDDDDEDQSDSDDSYRPPTAWQTGTRITNANINAQANLNLPSFQRIPNNLDSIAGAASHDLGSTLSATAERKSFKPDIRQLSAPAKEILPPFGPLTSTTFNSNFDTEATKDPSDPIVNFINRFDPNSPQSLKTAMTHTEILDLNKELPDGQSSAEEDRTASRNKILDSNFNFVDDNRKKGFTSSSRFDSVNIKTDTKENSLTDLPTNEKAIEVPEKVLVPPKFEYSEQPGSTAGPPIYYEWKWAGPGLNLEPPEISNETRENVEVPQGRSVSGSGESPFSHVTRPPLVELDKIPKIVAYNTSSYTVPDFVFPLDKPHVGYENENAKTSFMVLRKGNHNYGENPECPECHPAFLVPGTCEPCIVNR